MITAKKTRSKSEKTAKKSRAREAGPKEPTLSTVPAAKPEILTKLSQLLTTDDLKGAVKVWRQGLKAMKLVWSAAEKCYVEAGPDWEIRAKMAEILAAYMEGRPMERQMQITGSFEDLGELLSAMKGSGEAARLMPFVDSLPAA